ncbi:uncharacterized protein TNCV_379921 [Trichonephila clavipes]|nr:uncharacterized protein TNCV_379921 [Trichonephila clavipes]
MFSSIDRLTAEIRERFQQLPNIAQKYAFLMPEVILSIDELNLEQAHQDINNEEFQLERVRLQAFVAATYSGCTKELIRSGSLSLFKYIIEFQFEFPNLVIILRIFLTSVFSNVSYICRELKCLPDGVVWLLERESANSGVVHVT